MYIVLKPSHRMKVEKYVGMGGNLDLMLSHRMKVDRRMGMWVNAGAPGRISGSCSTSDTHHVTIKCHKHHLIFKWCWTPV